MVLINMRNTIAQDATASICRASKEVKYPDYNSVDALQCLYIATKHGIALSRVLCGARVHFDRASTLFRASTFRNVFRFATAS